MVTGVDMWGVWAKAAGMLDAADCDWRALQEIESLLRALSIDLERTVTVESAFSPGVRRARRAHSDLRYLESSLDWVREHEYDALESEIQSQLDTVVRCAMDRLDQLNQSQDETSSLYSRALASGNG